MRFESSTDAPPTISEFWNILIVDDEEGIHSITKTVLNKVSILGKGLNIISALNALEAKTVLTSGRDISLILLDVVMETSHSGLDLVGYIREDLQNNLVRIVIRTGQPDEAPEREIIEQFDIDDYKEKTELTAQKLYTTVRTAIKQYQQLLQLKQLQEQTYYRLTHNPLTQLPNRESLNESLDSDGLKSLMLINIDSFSLLNETQGFEAGDELLKQMGNFLNLYIQEYQPEKLMRVFHLEADLFGILCEKHDEVFKHDCISNLKHNISQHQFIIKEQVPYTISVTVGMALKEQGNLIKKAELALKEARSYGRNRSEIYSKDLNIIRTIHANSKWTSLIHSSLAGNKVKAFYQPIVSTHSGQIVHYEALVRICKGNGEIYSPGDFLEAARYSGQLYNIFQAVFEQTCQNFQSNKRLFSVNVTDIDLKEPDIFNYVTTTLEKFSIPPQQVVFEILETVSIHNIPEIGHNLERLVEYGIGIAIDDFGVNCSNFGQLANLKLSYLKIDGSFIRNILDDENSQIVTEVIHEYAKRRKIPVIAEFVSNREIYEYLKNIGIDYAQGYYLGKPSTEIIDCPP